MLPTFSLNRIIMIALSLAIAWGLKYHYSHADSDDLNWILRPTACLVQATTDMEFERITGTGYVDHENRITIAPTCSGVNFMIIVFCMSAYMGLKKIINIRTMIMWILSGIAASYIYTLIVNTIRINISIYSLKSELFQAWFSKETVHLLEGVLVYFIFLLIYYSILNMIINADPVKNTGWYYRQIKAGLLPMAFYFSITLLVPVLNHRGFPPGNEFADYALIVLATCPIILVLFFLVRICCHYLSVRLKCEIKHSA
jgi:exosortase K